MPQVQALVCLGPPVSFLSRSPSSAVTPLAPVFIPAFSLLPGEGFCGLHTFCEGCTRKGSGALLSSTQHVKRSCTMEVELGQLQKKKNHCINMFTSRHILPWRNRAMKLNSVEKYIYRHLDIYFEGACLIKKTKTKKKHLQTFSSGKNKSNQ